MDVFAYPSYYATESGALLNAVSHGKAIVASNIAPFREKEPAIWTFEDSDDLGEKIGQLLTSDSAREELEARAYEYALRNSWENVALRHVELYGEYCLGGGGEK
jgi:glycosyltransferase involved in cell wall biosynthesis